MCLRIELPIGELRIIPYQHLVTGVLTSAADGKVLRLSFSNHEVEIVGRNLRDLLVALHDCAVKWVRTMPTRYESIAERDRGMVVAIQITAAD